MGWAHHSLSEHVPVIDLLTSTLNGTSPSPEMFDDSDARLRALYMKAMTHAAVAPCQFGARQLTVPKLERLSERNAPAVL